MSKPSTSILRNGAHVEHEAVPRHGLRVVFLAPFIKIEVEGLLISLVQWSAASVVDNQPLAFWSLHNSFNSFN